MFLALASSLTSRLARLDSHGSTGPALHAQLYRRGSIGTALQARLYTGIAPQHNSTGKRRATHSKRPDAVKPIPKYAETKQSADGGVSGAGPKPDKQTWYGAKGTALQARCRHGSTGHSSTGMTLQARLYNHDSSGRAV